jgi:glycosyltransferase involved in cell wall biosynthesis
LKLSRYLLADRDSWQGAVLYLPEPGPIRTWSYLQLLPGLLPSKLVVTLHGSELEYLSALPHRRCLFHRLLRNADRVGVVSRFVKTALLSRYPDIEGKLVLSYGAVRSDLPDTSGTAHPSGHISLTDSGKWVLLTVGRIHPRKGQLAVVEALGLLAPQVRDQIVYRIVGPAVREDYLNEIVSRAATLQVSIECTGPLSDSELARAYSQARAFVMSSMYSKSSVEGFGLVYLEAGARALPVVAHDIGGVSDAVKNGETGILVPPDDRQALADAILRLFESPSLCKCLGEAGRTHAESFSWTRTARELFSDL